MNTLKTLKICAALSLSCLLPLAQAANMSQADYKATKSKIETEYKAEKASCGSTSGNAKDICMETAKGKEKVARADAEYAYTGKAGDMRKAKEAKVEAEYKVAKERCDDKAGNDKDVCVKEAKAAEIKSMADIKMNKEVAEAKSDASQEKRDADYKVAAEKCDSLAGDAKSSCVASAKAKFGKM